MTPTYLTVVEVIAIHDILIEEFGRSPGVRDVGAIEAAVFRPQTGYYDDALGEAAALMESLILSHPFVDGNKRTAFAAADVHLRLNGWYFHGDTEAGSQLIVAGLSEGRLDRQEMELWLRENGVQL